MQICVCEDYDVLAGALGAPNTQPRPAVWEAIQPSTAGHLRAPGPLPRGTKRMGTLGSTANDHIANRLDAAQAFALALGAQS